MLEIEVSLCESKILAGSGIIRTGGMGPCIGIGILNNTNKECLLIHEPNAHVNFDIEGHIINFISRQTPENFTVYITGGAIDGNDLDDDFGINEGVELSREYVQGIIESIFPINTITINWNKTSDIAELIYDSRLGTFEVEHTNL
jgi:hypothetical protein